MNQAKKISLGELWDETTAFLRAELALVAPVAMLCFGLPMVILLLAMPAPVDGRLEPGSWLWWLVPAGLLSMVGSVSLSAMALRPGASVRECLGIGFARLPAGIGLELFNAALQIALAIPIVFATMIEGGTSGPISSIVNLADLAVLIWLFVRVLPIWALLSERPMTPLTALRGAFALTRGQYRKLLLARVVGLVAGMIALLVIVVPVDAIFALIGRAPGLTAIANTLGFVATAAAGAMVLAVWTIYVARLHRRLVAIEGDFTRR